MNWLGAYRIMANEHQTAFDAARALSESERELLIERRLEGPIPEVDELSDKQFFVELERRCAEIEKDPSSAIPWTDVVNKE